MEGHSILSKRCAELLLQSCEQIGPVKSKYERRWRIRKGSGREEGRQRKEDDRQGGDEEEKESDRKEGEKRAEVDRT